MLAGHFANGAGAARQEVAHVALLTGGCHRALPAVTGAGGTGASWCTRDIPAFAVRAARDGPRGAVQTRNVAGRTGRRGQGGVIELAFWAVLGTEITSVAVVAYQRVASHTGEADRARGTSLAVVYAGGAG